MVQDYDAACSRLASLAGLRVLECDSSEDIGRRGGMTWIGDNAIEIGEPLGPETAPGRFVRDHGGGMHSIALEVGDLDATVAHLEARGVRVAARPRSGFFFTDPRDTRGVLFQWSHFVVEQDPRHGARLPAFSQEPLLAITHDAYVGAVVEDPTETALFFADLMGTAVTFEDPGAPPGRPWAGVSLGDCTLALYPMPGPDEERVWGRTYRRPRTHLLALAVADLDGSATLVAREGFGIVRQGDGTVILDPATTGEVQVALVGELLPDDPRL
jgi:catechol 2,3-dioxygenase-like lactoylglutathione lyase family enzyme